MKYVDRYGNEFESEEEIRAYATQNLFEDDGDFVEVVEDFVTCAELLNWIIENPTVLEKFKEDYETIIRIAQRSYAEDYFRNCEEVENEG